MSKRGGPPGHSLHLVTLGQPRHPLDSNGVVHQHIGVPDRMLEPLGGVAGLSRLRPYLPHS
jgi:hypothetical protein